MKKNLVSLAVAASVAASASAVVQAQQYVNPEKTGQVILFPFYNADNGNATNFHIVNTTKDVKAVKIRFVEYKNSDEVLDFNLYLSKEDHFAFGVIKDPNGDGAAVIPLTTAVLYRLWARLTALSLARLLSRLTDPSSAFSPL